MCASLALVAASPDPRQQVSYPSLESEIMVGPYILRLLLPGTVGVDVISVRPQRLLSALEAQELLSQLLFRLLGDPDHGVKLACVRTMERVRPRAEALGCAALHFSALCWGWCHAALSRSGTDGVLRSPLLSTPHLLTTLPLHHRVSALVPCSPGAELCQLQRHPPAVPGPHGAPGVCLQWRHP